MTIPYITPRMRELQNYFEEQAFRKLVRNDLQPTVKVLKYTAPTAGMSAFGDAKPAFNAAVSIDAVVESTRTPQNQRDWGTDERVVRMIYVLYNDVVDKFSTDLIDNRDRVTIDGTLYAIHGTHFETGMGHERVVVPITLVPPQDVGGT